LGNCHHYQHHHQHCYLCQRRGHVVDDDASGSSDSDHVIPEAGKADARERGGAILNSSFKKGRRNGSGRAHSQWAGENEPTLMSN
jgi:hypothetical protein